MVPAAERLRFYLHTLDIYRVGKYDAIDLGEALPDLFLHPLRKDDYRFAARDERMGGDAQAALQAIDKVNEMAGMNMEENRFS